MTEGSLGLYILDADGEPVRVEEVTDAVIAWGEWMEEARAADRLQVAFTELAHGIQVSTVFLGLDHAFLGGPPVLWETMWHTDYGWQGPRRYTSLYDALEGHAEVVAELFATTRLEAP